MLAKNTCTANKKHKKVSLSTDAALPCWVSCSSQQRQKRRPLFAFQNLTECISAKGKRTLFRYYDPRIMFAITTYHDEPIKKRILGPIEGLHGWEHGRRSQFTAGDGMDSGRRCTEEVVYPENFIDHIWMEVRIHTLLHVYSDSLAQSHPGALYPDVYDIMDNTYKFLNKHGFATKESFDLATAFAAEFPGSLWENEEIVQAVAQAKDKSSFEAALTSVLEDYYG